MKIKATVLMAVVSLSIGFMAALLLMSGGMLSVNADCPDVPDTPCGNGDVNADGKLNISDASYLLSFLFLGGPEPEPIPGDSCCLERPYYPAATGQAVCYDTSGNLIGCDSDDWPGQDALYSAGCPSAGRFVDNGDGTVTDNCTGLMWQQETGDLSGNSWIGEDDMGSWQQALQYCETLDLGDHQDWRLPNVRELQSIVDYGRWGPAIDPVFSTEINFYWTSSSGLGGPHLGTNEAWHVFFGIGSVYGTTKDALRYVRAVRTMTR